jgi:hypothetical protein
MSASDQKLKVSFEIPSQGLTCQILRFDTQTMMISLTHMKTKECYQRSISVQEIATLFKPVKGHTVPSSLTSSTSEFFEFLQECMTSLNDQSSADTIKTRIELFDRTRCNIVCDVHEEDCRLSINISLPFRDTTDSNKWASPSRSGVEKKVDKASSKVWSFSFSLFCLSFDVVENSFHGGLSF